MKKIPNKINKIINEFVEGVNKILGKRVKKIILYGSYARGDYNTRILNTDFKHFLIIKNFVSIQNA